MKAMVLGAILIAAAVGSPGPVMAQSADPYLGSIWLFGGNFCPRGTMEANGALLEISQNSALFSLYGTNYGGDGRTTFGIPDLRLDEDDPRFGVMRYCVATTGTYPSRS